MKCFCIYFTEYIRVYAHSFHDICVCVLEWHLVGHIIDIIPVFLLTTKLHTFGERTMRIIHYKHSIEFFLSLIPSGNVYAPNFLS